MESRRRQATCLHHSPAVEGGVGDDGDVRGELAPDPAKRKHRNAHGDQRKTSEFVPSWAPPLAWYVGLVVKVQEEQKIWGLDQWSQASTPGQGKGLGFAPHSLFDTGFEKSITYATGYSISS